MSRNPDYIYEISFLDHSGEVSRTKLHVASTVTLASDAVSAWGAALATIAVGLAEKHSVSAIDRLSTASVGDGNREDKWLFGMHDATTLAEFHFTLPCRDASVLTPSGTDKITDFTASPWNGVKTAIEALALSPDGNAGVLDYVQLVGRNI